MRSLSATHGNCTSLYWDLTVLMVKLLGSTMQTRRTIHRGILLH